MTSKEQQGKPQDFINDLDEVHMNIQQATEALSIVRSCMFTELDEMDTALKRDAFIGNCKNYLTLLYVTEITLESLTSTFETIIDTIYSVGAAASPAEEKT